MLPCRYTIVDISEEKEVGFKAIIPDFPKLYVVADSPMQLHNVVQEIIKEEILKMKSSQNKNRTTCIDEGCISLNSELQKQVNEIAKLAERKASERLANKI